MEIITAKVLLLRPFITISWWRHRMEIVFALLAICAVNSPVTGEFPSQRPVTQSFDVFSSWLNKRLGKQSWGWGFKTPSRSLWCYCNDCICSWCIITETICIEELVLPTGNWWFVIVMPGGYEGHKAPNVPVITVIVLLYWKHMGKLNNNFPMWNY